MDPKLRNILESVGFNTAESIMSPEFKIPLNSGAKHDSTLPPTVDSTPPLSTQSIDSEQEPKPVKRSARFRTFTFKFQSNYLVKCCNSLIYFSLFRFAVMPSNEGLPNELVKLFEPLECNLCHGMFNSSQTAKPHYESRNHGKKFEDWLNIWCARTGQSLPKFKVVERGLFGRRNMRCDVCHLNFTSLQHAKQHLMGKKHKKYASFNINFSLQKAL